MTKGDIYTKEILNRILDKGTLDVNPRPKYEDGTPAHTLSVNHGLCTYDQKEGETPLITLRPIATKSAIGELLWIYRDQSNDLDLLKDKYGVDWWDKWDIGDRTIGHCYGGTIKEHDIMTEFWKDLKEDPDGRRHNTNMWQVDDFKKSHGLKPCAFQTFWNVRHELDGDYLDMCLFQRSSDFMTAGCINQTQYLVFLYLVVNELNRDEKVNYKPGRFTWMYDNIQIYDRHITQAHEMLERESYECSPSIEIDKDVTWDTVMPENVHIVDYPKELIKKKNPQMKFELGI